MADETKPAPAGFPYPEGHGLQVNASAVCLCGRLVLECRAMDRWAAWRRQPMETDAWTVWVVLMGYDLDILGVFATEGAAKASQPKVAWTPHEYRKDTWEAEKPGAYGSVYYQVRPYPVQGSSDD